MMVSNLSNVYCTHYPLIISILVYNHSIYSHHSIFSPILPIIYLYLHLFSYLYSHIIESYHYSIYISISKMNYPLFDHFSPSNFLIYHLTITNIFQNYSLNRNHSFIIYCQITHLILLLDNIHLIIYSII